MTEAGPNMPAYMDACVSVAEGINGLIASPNNPEGRNREALLMMAEGFEQVGLNTVAEVRENWKPTARERVYQLGAQVTGTIIEADDNGQVVPPLKESQRDELIERRNLWVRALEGAAPPTETPRPTPVDKINTTDKKA